MAIQQLVLIKQDSVIKVRSKFYFRESYLTSLQKSGVILWLYFKISIISKGMSNDGRPWWVPAHATGWTPAQQNTTVTPLTSTASQIQSLQPAGPSLMTMATNLASTALSAASHAIRTGVVMASEETANKRIETCESCEFLDKTIYRCLKCGCMMKFKAKVEAAKCPIGKW
jgi:hypothetical protein